MHRREFISNSIATTAWAMVTGNMPLRAQVRPKRILVLGGTLFLGPAFVEAALSEGHIVTLFNRGVTNPSLFPSVEKLRGFRSAQLEDQNLSALGTRHWDAVIDIWPNDPSLAESAAQLLKDRTDHYLYVSSIAAYDKTAFQQTYVSENSPLTAWNAQASGYSRGKAESERRLAKILGSKLTVVRPGGIKGNRDDTPDMLIWLRRLQTQPGVIVPGTGAHPVAIVDVKDIADFLLSSIDHAIFGTFNLAGQWMSFRTFLEQCRAAIHSDSELVWVPESFLQEQGVYPQSLSNWLLNFPYCRADHGSLDGGPVQGQISDQKALSTGWQNRPLRDTVLDSLASFYFLSTQGGYTFRDTLPPVRQTELLTLWRKQHPS